MLKRIKGLDKKILTSRGKEIPSADGPTTVKSKLLDYLEGMTGTGNLDNFPGGRKTDKGTATERAIGFKTMMDLAASNGEVVVSQEQYNLLKRLADEDRGESICFTEPLRIAVDSAENVEDLAACK